MVKLANWMTLCSCILNDTIAKIFHPIERKAIPIIQIIMKILPEHETLLTVVSKLIQVVWITFELPMHDINISNCDNFSIHHIATKKSTFHDDNEEKQHYYDGIWNAYIPSSVSILDLSLLLSSANANNVCSDVHYISPELKSIENMMIERDIPCRVTGVLTRGIY